jgi:hypothetical protein
MSRDAFKAPKTRTSIEDLPTTGHELSDEDLRLASGGRWHFASYTAASCTLNCDTDYRRSD